MISSSYKIVIIKIRESIQALMQLNLTFKKYCAIMGYVFEIINEISKLFFDKPIYTIGGYMRDLISIVCINGTPIAHIFKVNMGNRYLVDWVQSKRLQVFENTSVKQIEQSIKNQHNYRGKV